MKFKERLWFKLKEEEDDQELEKTFLYVIFLIIFKY